MCSSHLRREATPARANALAIRMYLFYDNPLPFAQENLTINTDVKPYNSMHAKVWALQEARRKGRVRTADLVGRMQISRQTAAQHLRELVAARKLVKLGSTRSAVYVSSAAGSARIPSTRFTSLYPRHGLEEDRVFREVDLRLGLRRLLSPAAYRIAGYAFSEMLNNAIDHSASAQVAIQVECRQGDFRFEIRDWGVGAFESIRKKFGLKNHFEAIEHLAKGKQSADPKHHSGQGIFFTSKIADRFMLESHRLFYTVDNRLEDVFLKDVRSLKGTRVEFVLKQHSRKNLKELFDEYSGNDYSFDRTKIVVRLSQTQGEHISRSQARRLLFGLEKFRRILFDFKKVDEIGQGFADEIFRVFHQAHPSIRLESIHASPSVEFMIRRAQKM